MHIAGHILQVMEMRAVSSTHQIHTNTPSSKISETITSKRHWQDMKVIYLFKIVIVHEVHQPNNKSNSKRTQTERKPYKT